MSIHLSSTHSPLPARSSAGTTAETWWNKRGPSSHIKHPYLTAQQRHHPEGGKESSLLHKLCLPLACHKIIPAPTSSRELLGVDDLGCILLSCQHLHTSPNDGECTPGETRSQRDVYGQGHKLSPDVLVGQGKVQGWGWTLAEEGAWRNTKASYLASLPCCPWGMNAGFSPPCSPETHMCLLPSHSSTPQEKGQ